MTSLRYSDPKASSEGGGYAAVLDENADGLELLCRAIEHRLGPQSMLSDPTQVTMPIPMAHRLHVTGQLTDGHMAMMGMGLRVCVKAKRKRASPSQVAALEAFFAQNPFPTAGDRARLGWLTSMHPRSVQIWFQNKRQAWKHAHMSIEKIKGP